MKRLFLIILCLLIPFSVFAWDVQEDDEAIISLLNVASGEVTCSGSFDAGQYESFEQSTPDTFCTTGITISDIDGAISTNNTSSPHCGTQNMRISEHTSNLGYVQAEITPDNSFTLRGYINLISIGTQFKNISSLVLYDSTFSIDSIIYVGRDAGADYRFRFSSSSSDYFSITPGTQYYYVLTWALGTDNTTLELYNADTKAAITPTGGVGNTIVSTEIDEVKYIRYLTSLDAFTLDVDDWVIDHDSGDLSGGQICN